MASWHVLCPMVPTSSRSVQYADDTQTAGRCPSEEPDDIHRRLHCTLTVQVGLLGPMLNVGVGDLVPADRVVESRGGNGLGEARDLPGDRRDPLRRKELGRTVNEFLGAILTGPELSTYVRPKDLRNRVPQPRDTVESGG